MFKPAKNVRQRGFSLVEVMVAAVVFSMGLGGLSLMLMTAVHGTIEARNQTEAAMHASSLAELILLNPASTGHYINPPPLTETACAEPPSCSGANWAARNLASWQEQLQQSLAGATGLVCLDSSPNDGNATAPACDGIGRAVVKVFWSEPQHRDAPDDGLRRVVLRLPD
jgi:type IV pilus assembly protein PilV